MDRGLEIPKVGDISVRNVIAFREDDSVRDVVKVFNEYRISSAPVINRNNEVMGFLSESDILKCMGNCLFFDEQRNPNVESIMTKKVHMARSNWDIFELETFFLENHVRSAPVVDEEGHVEGVITRRDALKAIEEVLRNRSDYKQGIKKPIELNMFEKIKILVDNH